MKTLIALSVMLVSAAAVSEDQPVKNPEAASQKSAQAKFEALDRNNDDALNKLEVRSDAALAAQFEWMDINADGFVSKREYLARVTQPRPSEPPYRQ